MIVLDTDHFSVLTYGGERRRRELERKIDLNSGERFCITIVSFEEAARGWLARVRREHEFAAQVVIYSRLMQLFDVYRRAVVLPFDSTSSEIADRLRRAHVRVGTQDLKIAAIALSHNATILTANERDFSRIPGLQIENWLTA
jgi:tRNA(fMet)-specific endonuclease VapC